MPQTILVVGATGLVGEPVARRLAADGHAVRVMSRDRARAAARFGDGFEAVAGDVDDIGSLRGAMEGCTGIHLSVSGQGDWDLERRSAVNACRLASDMGIERLSITSGASTSEANAWFPGTRAKLEAERIIVASGVPYTIFRCTMFMELLPKLVRNGRAMILGEQPHRWRWIAGNDYGALVSKAHTTPDAAGKTLYVFGPEALTFEEAVRIYQSVCAPEAKVTKVPFFMLRLMSWMPGRGELRNAGLPIMEYFSKVTECGDARECHELLGVPQTTVRAWCQARQG